MIHTAKLKRIEIYHNTNGKTPEAIKAETGCTTILNGVLFNGDGSLCCDNRINGVTISNDQYTYWGYGWNKDKPQIVHSSNMAQYTNYISCLCALRTGQKEPVNDNTVGIGGTRGRTAIGFKADRSFVVLCTSDSNGAMKLSQVQSKMLELGCVDALILDGGGSCYLDCPTGKVDTSYSRKVGNKTYILIWEEDMERKYKVCLDAGHGTREPNQSPDGRYLEYKMAWKLSNKIKELLLSTDRFDVKLTKDSEGATPTLAQRAKTANDFDADLFWSTHSNAVSGGWNDKIRGLTAWIYALGGNRQRIAELFLEQCKELDIELFGTELYTAKFAVLAQTAMPAVLIENYFHTCRTDVEKLLQDEEIETLAYAAARGICEYFNLGEDLIPLKPEEIEEEYKVWTDILYRVQTGAFADENNAKKMLELLESQGYSPIIKEEKR